MQVMEEKDCNCCSSQMQLSISQSWKHEADAIELVIHAKLCSLTNALSSNVWTFCLITAFYKFVLTAEVVCRKWDNPSEHRCRVCSRILVLNNAFSDVLLSFTLRLCWDQHHHCINNKTHCFLIYVKKHRRGCGPDLKWIHANLTESKLHKSMCLKKKKKKKKKNSEPIHKTFKLE